MGQNRPSVLHPPGPVHRSLVWLKPCFHSHQCTGSPCTSWRVRARQQHSNAVTFYLPNKSKYALNTASLGFQQFEKTCKKTGYGFWFGVFLVSGYPVPPEARLPRNPKIFNITMTQSCFSWEHVFANMGVSWNWDTPKSSTLKKCFFIINLPFWGTPTLANHHIRVGRKVRLHGTHTCLVISTWNAYDCWHIPFHDCTDPHLCCLMATEQWETMDKMTNLQVNTNHQTKRVALPMPTIKNAYVEEEEDDAADWWWWRWWRCNDAMAQRCAHAWWQDSGIPVGMPLNRQNMSKPSLGICKVQGALSGSLMFTVHVAHVHCI